VSAADRAAALASEPGLRVPTTVLDFSRSAEADLPPGVPN
jgi:hypothetical protein